MQCKRNHAGYVNRFRSGKGNPFHPQAVIHIRRKYTLKGRYKRLRERGMMTVDEVLRQAGITQQTLHRWRREGRVQAQAYNDKRQYLYDLTAGIPQKNQPPGGKRASALDHHHRGKEVSRPIHLSDAE